MAHITPLILGDELNKKGLVRKAPEEENHFWDAAADYLKDILPKKQKEGINDGNILQKASSSVRQEAGENGIAKPVSKISQRFAQKSYLQPNEEAIWSRMLEESALLEKLDHPNVARYLQRSLIASTETHDQKGGELRLMIELFARGSLEDLLATAVSPLSENDILSYFHCALSAVVYIHGKGMVHRNIKPSNLFVKDDGGLKLGDFGIERICTDAEKSSVTGMLDYVAPEARNPSGEYSAASDVWSLACVLCYLCNQPDGHMSTYQIPTYYSSWLEPLLLSMLNTNPVRRPSAESVMAALKYQQGRFSSRYDVPDKAASAPTAGDLITHFQRHAVTSTGSPVRATPPPAGAATVPQLPLTTPMMKSLHMVSAAKRSMKDDEVQSEQVVPMDIIPHHSPRLSTVNVHPNPMYGLEEAGNSGRDPQPDKNGYHSSGNGTGSPASEGAGSNLSSESTPHHRNPVVAHSLKGLQAVQAGKPPQRPPWQPQTLDIASSSDAIFTPFMFNNNEYDRDVTPTESELSASTVTHELAPDMSVALTSPRSVKGSADLRRFLELKNAEEYHEVILGLVDAPTWKEDLENISLDDLLNAGVKKSACLRILRAVRDGMQDLESLLRRTYSESLRPSTEQGSVKSERICSEIGSVYEDAMSEVNSTQDDGTSVSSFRPLSFWDTFGTSSPTMEVIAEDPIAERHELEKKIVEIYEQHRDELKEKLEQQATTWMESTKVQLDHLKAELKAEQDHSALKDAEIERVINERNEMERRLANEEAQCAELRQMIDELKEEQLRLTSGTLQSLARRGEANEVELLLMKDVDPNDDNERDTDRATPLHNAAKYGHTTTVEILIRAGSTIDARDAKQFTPLHWAAVGGFTSTVEVLLEAGADVKAQDMQLCTPLHEAAYNGHDATVLALLAVGADIHAEAENKSTPLHGAVISGHATTVDTLISSGADVNIPDRSLCTPLHWAAIQGEAASASSLIHAGANIEALAKNDCTPLHWAAINGYSSVIEQLIAAHAQIDAQSADGFTPLHFSASNGHTACAEFLVQAGASLDALTKEKCTALHLASINGRTETAQYLIKVGANIHAKNEAWFAISDYLPF